ncbi:MAG: PAS domain S-box protein [Nitrospirae bacterium]|nr:PAS domain S-box protein [Nitrospirota bacterium]
MTPTVAKYLSTVWPELSGSKVVFAAAVILLIANLGALIDLIFHPEIPYFHEEHLIVGGITALLTAVLFVILTMHLKTSRISEKRLRSLFDVSPDFILILDTNGVIIQTNQASVSGSGYRKRELIGHGINEFLTPSSQKIFEKHFPVLMELGSCRVEIESVLKDGSVRVMDCRAIALRDREGKITSLMSVQRDITERKQAEAEREKLVVQLQEALEKVKTLRGFIPICASCKKVRDDKGYWTQVEAYVSEHSLAEFSHSICPECMKKLYPEYPMKEDHT